MEVLADIHKHCLIYLAIHKTDIKKGKTDNKKIKFLIIFLRRYIVKGTLKCRLKKSLLVFFLFYF